MTGARIVTVSATYGAGGSVIAPRLARKLDMPFHDRMILAKSGDSVETIAEHLGTDERRQGPAGRMITTLSGVSAALGLAVYDVRDLDPLTTLRRFVEQSVGDIAEGSGGVVLGRAAAVVLGDRSDAFHVRLFGEAECCLLRGMSLEQVPRSTAKRYQAAADRERERFVSRLFERRADDPSLYHLMIDSTVIGIDFCVDLIAAAARRFWGDVAEPHDAPR